VVAKATQLNKQQQLSLLHLLQKYEALFDGTLGKWNTDPVNIELREDAKPVSSRNYPVPKINKETFRKDLLRLVDIGVLTPVQDSEWGTPVFIIPKDDGTVRFITDYRKVNKLIKRKPYPLPRIANTLQELEGFQFASALDLDMLIKRKPYPLPHIANTLQELEGFQFASALDLNMGYYTIRLTPGAKDLTTIVTEFGKFRYNILPMGMCCSGDVFQAKVDQLLGDIEGIKTYIDDILVISKGSFDDHLKQLDTCFKRIQEARLKVNADKCSFGLSEIPYLGYIISREGSKPDPLKIQGIMDMNRPRTTTEVRAITGSVQYYRHVEMTITHSLSTH
jgi:Reverse transcriptase (RNA-dependent DNA polymerase).